MRIAWPLVALLFASCGGSSSETPPPLEPDPTGYRYSGPRLPSADEESAAAPEPAPEVDEDDLPPSQQRKPAVATWGSGKPARQAAPVPSPSASAAPLPSAAPIKPLPSAAPSKD